MAYHLIEFDGVSLPVYNPRQDHSPTQAASPILETIGGGYYDRRGTQKGRPTLQSIPVTGLAWGEETYLVDEAGVYLVDEAGNFVTSGDAVAVLRSQMDALAEKVGTRGRVVRKRFDDNVRQFKTARLLSLPTPQEVEDRLFRAEITLQFESKMTYWHNETASTATGSATNGVPLLLPVENSGQQRIDDAALTILCTSGFVTQVDIVCATLGINMTWTGSLPPNYTLTLDCGDEAPPDGATDAYSLTLNSGHSAAGWLTIPRGAHLYSVTVTGGAATVTMNYHLQYA